MFGRPPQRLLLFERTAALSQLFLLYIVAEAVFETENAPSLGGVSQSDYIVALLLLAVVLGLLCLQISEKLLNNGQNVFVGSPFGNSEKVLKSKLFQSF